MRANGAKVVSGFDQLIETRFVDEVIARRDLTGLSTRVNVLLTNGTIGPRQVLDAPVSPVVQVRGQTHVARRTVEKVVSAADPANAAAVAVKLVLK